MRRVMLLDRLVERRDCLRYERRPSFNWKEDALETWIILVLEITFALESDVNLSVYRHELCTHVSIMDFEILKSEKLVLLILILNLHEIVITQDLSSVGASDNQFTPLQASAQSLFENSPLNKSKVF